LVRISSIMKYPNLLLKRTIHQFLRVLFTEDPINNGDAIFVVVQPLSQVLFRIILFNEKEVHDSNNEVVEMALGTIRALLNIRPVLLEDLVDRNIQTWLRVTF
jgi:hypothetical protein